MKNGPYILVIAPPEYLGKRYRDRYCYEHNLVWWQNTGETITEGELIHHKDENKTHNEFSNLEKKTIAAHSKHHARKAATIELTCPMCNELFEMQVRNYKMRRKQYGHTDFCCSRSCQVSKQQREREHGQPVHGTRRMYTHHKCRCVLCKSAQAKYMREYKRKAGSIPASPAIL